MSECRLSELTRMALTAVLTFWNLENRTCSFLKMAGMISSTKPMNIQRFLSLQNYIACVLAIVAGTFLLSGCVSPGSSSASTGVSIGMSKQDVTSVVGRGNVTLAKKRTQTTANGVKEVWVLYKGPLGWGWTENAMDKPVGLNLKTG